MIKTQKPILISPDEFVRNLNDSGLFSSEDLRQALSLIPTETIEDGTDIARQLVAAGKLTSYQASNILERRFSDLHIGGYEVLELLGKGGMGTVYKARHRRMKRIAALKVLSPEIAKQGSFVQRFQREVETIAQLSHVNIVMAFDAGESEAGHFLVMEFVNGRDLASHVQKSGPMQVAEALDCTLQAARGLEYAHAQGLVHRDIKPANLLRDMNGVVKVADLGLARINSMEGTESSSSLTQAGGIVGTMDFMPPEQALDSTRIDQRADMYSLGCTLYFLLTGRPPYIANSLMALLLQHRDAPIPSLTAVRADVPDVLNGIFQKMVAKKSEDRFVNMSEVIRQLESAKNSSSLLSDRSLPVRQPGASGSSSNEMTVAADSAAQLAIPATAATLAPSMPGTVPSVVRRVLDLTIILAEPSRTQAGIIRKYLQNMRIDDVFSTGSGQQALTLAQQHQAHVVVSSMHLTDMTGVDLVAALRATPGNEQTGFVVATSESDGGEASKLLQLPHTVLMTKPFDLKKLATAIAEATGRTPQEILPPG